jgi:tripartite-type tricarboxylate transporter receptor subunit TctC
MRLLRKVILGLMACMVCGHMPAHAQEWPSRPIRIVVVFPPGGSSDIVARVLAETIAPRLNARIVVDNRPGAGGTVAALHVAQQPADGYTLMLSNTAPIVTSPPIYRQAGYDPMNGFTHIAYIGATPMIVVTHPSVPATDMASLMAWMRAQRTPPVYGSSGVGSVGHILGSMFETRTGIALTHAPYRGAQPMQTDLMGGSILLSFDTLPENVENVRAGRTRAYAVSGSVRSPMLPEVPTTAEAGLPGLLAENWLGLAGPAGMPAPVVARLHSEVNWALTQQSMLDRLAQFGITPGTMSQPEFVEFVRTQIGTMGEAVKAMNLSVN